MTILEKLREAFADSTRRKIYGIVLEIAPLAVNLGLLSGTRKEIPRNHWPRCVSPTANEVP